MTTPQQSSPPAPQAELGCFDCGRPYSKGPDLVIPDEAWAKIAPKPGGGGVLCPNCIHDRLEAAGFGYGAARGLFTSGPLAQDGPAPQAVKELVERLDEALAFFTQSPPPKNGPPTFSLEGLLIRCKRALTSLQEDRDRLERLYRERTELAEAQRRRAEQAERDLAAERERGKELERAIGMQDVRLMVGEGRLSAQNVLAGVNAVIRHRAALFRPASTEPSLGESAGNDEQITSGSKA